MNKAKIIEIFSSIQGEGLYVGEKQTFVRFYGCNLSCKYCDEKNKNRYTIYSVDSVTRNILIYGNKVVSLTGGEPLMHNKFLKILLPALKRKKIRTYLETNGTLVEDLKGILDFVDVISMDFKLPSSTGLKQYWKEHAVFLKESVKRKVFVKAVVTEKTTSSDIKKAVDIIESIDKKIPLILQPVSYNNKIEKIKLIHDFADIAFKRLDTVRIIPQMHKVLGVK